MANSEKNPTMLQKLPCTHCGLSFPVRVGIKDEDFKRIAEAAQSNSPTAALTRFCPFCMEEREVTFHIPDQNFKQQMEQTVKSSVSQNPESAPRLMTHLSGKPIEWDVLDKARALAEKKDDGAKEMYLKAAELLRRKKMFLERYQVLTELAGFLADWGRTEEAEEIRKNADNEIRTPRTA